MPSVSARGRSRPIPLLLPLLGFAVVLVLPMLPFLGLLAQYAWYDTPQGYLIWIPLAAVASLYLGLKRCDLRQKVDVETDWFVALPFLSLAAVLLLWGNTFWPLAYLPLHLAFLIWPLWALGAGVLYWGVDALPALVVPSVYLALAWPTWPTWVQNFSQSVLVQWAGWGLHQLLPLVQGARFVAGSTPVVALSALGQPLGLAIGSACSGSDMLLGLYLFVIPFLLFWQGGWLKKFLFLVALFPIAILVNILRLFFITLAARYLGAPAALSVVHPLAGPVLFLVVFWLLVTRVPWSRPAHPNVTTAARPAPRVALLLAGAALAVYLFFVTTGTSFSARPVTVPNTAWQTLSPPVAGYRVSFSQSVPTQATFGAGSQDVLVNYWRGTGNLVVVRTITTPQEGSLTAYTFANCFRFHGDQAIAGNLQLAPSLPARLDRVKFLGGKRLWYIMYWQWPLRIGQETQWQRVAIYTLADQPSANLVAFARSWVAGIDQPARR
ncbi:MAG: archaeosortase/exosortase family protein [Thermaerobacter sp.]|nr:archaeosortase/exosortase family protein [Thermaerobacter sp.]